MNAGSLFVSDCFAGAMSVCNSMDGMRETRKKQEAVINHRAPN